MKNLELYIHIPFCVRKCAYCDFLSFASCEEERDEYVKALLEELDLYKQMAKEYLVSTIFIGGGTPSVLSGNAMVSIMNKVREIFVIEVDAEITIEVNPGTITEEKVLAYKSVGINRVSIGLQATNDEELKMLGRIHCYEEFLDTYHLLHKHGITNINIDLISAIPKQTVASWTETLERIIELQPTHISAYSLIIEEGTLFHDKLEDYEELLPSEEDEREMYHLTKRKLAKAGYLRYEISNYAKEGYECRHNLGYWDRVDYLGIGLGAASLLQNVRYSNERDMKEYISKCQMFGKCRIAEQGHDEEACTNRSIISAGVRVEAEVLSRNARMEEYMFLGLRKIQGVSIAKFQECFQVSMESVYGDVLEKLSQKKLVIIEETEMKETEMTEVEPQEQEKFLRLTELGVDLSNYVLSEFII